MLLEISQDKIPSVWHKHFYFTNGSLKKWVNDYRESCEWIEKYDKEYYINLARIYNARSLFSEYILQRTAEMKEDKVIFCCNNFRKENKKKKRKKMKKNKKIETEIMMTMLKIIKTWKRLKKNTYQSTKFS